MLLYVFYDCIVSIIRLTILLFYHKHTAFVNNVLHLNIIVGGTIIRRKEDIRLIECLYRNALHSLRRHLE